MKTDAREKAQLPEETGKGGEFERQTSAFREWVSADGTTDHPAASGRYHLYVSLACPWAHRTILARKLLGLEDVLTMTVVDPIRDERGWRFREGEPDRVNGFEFLSEAYRATDPDFDQRVSVPVLWDRETSRIVNNESAEILRMLEIEFAAFHQSELDLYPHALREEIDALNEHVYESINNGVYKAGFATTQSAYEAAYDRLFDALDGLEARLTDRRYLLGERLTETDLRLFTTLIRFDAVYHGHFKCNARKITEYPALWGWLRDVYQVPGVASTVDFDHIKRHYHLTHERLNPAGLVPKGPVLELDTAHGRENLGR